MEWEPEGPTVSPIPVNQAVSAAVARDCTVDKFDIESARADTLGCRSVLHLNNAGAALMPRPVVEVMVSHLQAEASVGGYEAAIDATEQLDLVYTAVATMLGCSPDEIAILDNATRAWTLVVQSIPLGQGDRVLVGEAEYISNCIALEAICARTGARLQMIPTDKEGRVCVDTLRNMVDEHVKLIAVTHIPIYGGRVNPIVEIGRIAHQANSIYVVDACQSMGQVPIDIQAVGCDFLTAAGRKYLRGPRGTAILYARSTSVTKLSHFPPADVYGTRWLPDGRCGVRDDARRFESWETNCAAKIGLGLAVEYANQWRVASTWLRVRSLGAHLRMALSELSEVQLYDTAGDACGIVSFAVGSAQPEKMRIALADRGINVSISEPTLTPRYPIAQRFGSVIRASVHYYNTREEIDTFVETLDSLARRSGSA
ncbi:MAG: aminotransferase class V-fold PLP-dependent enzyme [Pseudonocardiaceae bacterium]